MIGRDGQAMEIVREVRELDGEKTLTSRNVREDVLESLASRWSDGGPGITPHQLIGGRRVKHDMLCLHGVAAAEMSDFIDRSGVGATDLSAVASDAMDRLKRLRKRMSLSEYWALEYVIRDDLPPTTAALILLGGALTKAADFYSRLDSGAEYV